MTMIILTIAASVVLPVGKIYVVQNIEENLKTNLLNVRNAIEKYNKDTSENLLESTTGYPRSIDVLLRDRYLRRMEIEPFGARWQYAPSTGVYVWKDFIETTTNLPYLTFGRSYVAQGTDEIFNIRTSASNTGLNGTIYTNW
ncbi:MAG TPA: hypothetical protein PKK26_06375 [Candidatus Wallbacteria bacterium]|nr:hypothetical protein [Candidatus Wallbacteria bacterium]